MHQIRLEDPWGYEVTDRAIRFTRNFNWLAKLDPGEQLFLIVGTANLPGSVELNGNSLGELNAGDPQSGWEFEITQQVGASNRLAFHFPLDVSSAASARSRYFQQVLLEIRPPEA